MQRASKRNATPSFIETLENRTLLADNPVVSVGAVTSSTVGLSWNAIPGASSIRVYLAPEPSATVGAPLPNQVLIQTLSGSATSYQFTGLAPAVDAFLRVEATVSGQTVATNVSARTKGGQRAILDNAVREVHMLAPNVLQVVLTDNIDNGVGNDGPTYQSGTWSVTRSNSTSIGVTNKYRRTAAIGQPDYTLGYGGGADWANVDVDHSIYLVLNQNVGNREVLTITGPGVSFKLPFSDKYLETPVIQLNQVGYNPRATERWAYISHWMGNGGGLSLSNFPGTADVLIQPTNPMALRTVALDNTAITLRSSFDAESGAPVKQINLASLPAAEGVRYRIQIDGVGVSWATAVSEEAAYKAYYVSTRGMYHNRWAGDLRLENTEFARPQDHVDRPDGTPTVYTAELGNWTQMHSQSTPLTGARDVVGGHHDAGDFDLRAPHTSIPQLLMRSYEINPAAQTDGLLAIPESGNGVPDLLDEALWNIQSWEALQETDGGVRAGVESWRHPFGYYYANEEPLAYWTYARDPQVTARAAGVFAQMAYLLRNLDGNTTGYDDTRANELQTRAINAYNWANNSNNRDYRNESAARSYLLYASGELYRLTNNTTYKTAFETHWDALNVWGRGAYDALVEDMGYFGDYTELHRVMQDYTQGYLHASGSKRADIVTVATNELTTRAANYLDNQDNDHAHRHPSNTGTNPDWGNSTTPGKYLDTIYGRLSVGGVSPAQQQEYFNAMSLAADYVLGANPMGYSWITGLGSRNPNDVLHLDYQTFKANGKGLMPGIPVYGPVNGFSSLDYYQPTISAFYPAIASPGNPSELPLMLRFGDTKTFVNSSEFDAPSVMTPHAQLFGALLKTGMSVPASWRSGGYDFHNPITAFGTATNRAPVVEAGWPMTGTSGLAMAGQMVDDGFTAGVTTTWTQVSGPGVVAFNNANLLNATANFSSPGTYVLRLTANDGQASASDDVTVQVTSAATSSIFTNGGFESGIPAAGQWPAGYAGSNVSGANVLSNTVGGEGSYVLRVTSGDWMYPAISNEPQRDSAGQKTNTEYRLSFKAKFAVTTTKTVVVAIVGNNAASFASLTISGADTNWHDYSLTFNSGVNNRFYVAFVHEGGGGNSRDYYLDSIAVSELAANAAPVVNAGTDATITLPAYANLDASATDDGRPNPTLTTTWSKYSGPGSVTFGNPGVVDTTATFSVAGTYVLRLTANDGALQSYDDVTITVNPANNPPVVNAGPDATVTLPAAANLDGTVTDSDSSPTVAWTTVSGPGPVTFGNASAVDTTATFTQAGTYVLRLTANDGVNQRYDDVSITVNPAAGGGNSVFANSGFETGNLSGWSGASSGLAVVSNTVGGTGAYVLRVTAGDWQYPAIGNQPQAGTGITVNTNYVFSFKIKWNASTNKTILASVIGDGATTIASQSISYIDTSWRTYSINFNSGDTYGNGTEAIYIAFSHEGGGGAARDYYLDEVRVYPRTSIFSNSGFETGNLSGWSGTSSGLSVVNNTVGGTGSYVLRVAAGDWLYPAIGNQPQAGSGVQLANTNYVLSFDMKWNQSTNKKVRAAVIGEGGAAIAYLDVSYANTSWSTYTLNFNSGDTYGNGVEPFYIQFIHEGGGGAARDYYLDNVLVYPA